MKKIALAASVCLAAAGLSGCFTSPVSFESCSVPVPATGFSVCGSDVEGTHDRIWVFGIGGTLSESPQHIAYKSALGKANGADALVGMTIDEQSVFVIPFFSLVRTRVVGTPVKFANSGKEK